MSLALAGEVISRDRGIVRAGIALHRGCHLLRVPAQLGDEGRHGSDRAHVPHIAHTDGHRSTAAGGRQHRPSFVLTVAGELRVHPAGPIPHGGLRTGGRYQPSLTWSHTWWDATSLGMFSSAAARWCPKPFPITVFSLFLFVTHRTDQALALRAHGLVRAHGEATMRTGLGTRI